MKIVHLTKYFPPQFGGVEIYTYLLAKAAMKEGHEVTVIAFNTTPKFKKEKWEGINVIRMPKILDFFRTPISFPFINILGKLKPEIIHLHSPNPWMEWNLLFYKFFSKSKIIVSYHSDIVNYTPIHSIFNFLRYLFLFPLYTLSNKIIISTKNYAQSSDVIKTFRKKTVIIPYGVNEDTFKSSTKKKNNKLTLLYVGRLAEYKGLEYLIQAIKQISEKEKSFVLHIFGYGEFKEKLKSLVRTLNLEKFVIFDKISSQYYPSEKEKIKKYQEADVFILPSISRAEAFGIVLLEAMASGLPIICTDVSGSGMSFINQNNQTGLVVKAKDPKSLSEAILKMRDPKLREKFGKNARKRFLELFTEKSMIEKTQGLYQKTENN